MSSTRQALLTRFSALDKTTQVKKVSYIYDFLAQKSDFFESLSQLIKQRGTHISDNVLQYMYDLILNISDRVDEKQDERFAEHRDRVRKIAELDDTDEENIESLLESI